MAGFKAKASEVLLVPGQDGVLEQVVFGLGAPSSVAAAARSFRSLPSKLGRGQYGLAQKCEGLDQSAIALAWALGSYSFDRYKSQASKPSPQLVVGAAVDAQSILQIAQACALAKDMVNTPANDMGPAEIEAVARDLAQRFGAEISVITGDALLAQNYPAVHAVGRASHESRASRMIEITWGRPEHPLICLVGKGVVFDTGGLDMKPSAGMRLMKKDMGGAAHALALGQMIMAADLPVRLVILTPVVENAISGDAMRPGDVLASRKGLTIEVGNTDAEGRLILADALSRGSELDPVLTIDLATLTGAARVALGPQVIPFFTADEALASELAAASEATGDALWRLPLWAGYEPALDSDIADLKNDPDGWAQAGAMTAALFLQRFAPKGAWVHLDIYAWNPRKQPGHPLGAEAQAILALFAMIKARFA
jgi:leucyl aminopeptidase